MLPLHRTRTDAGRRRVASAASAARRRAGWSSRWGNRRTPRTSRAATRRPHGRRVSPGARRITPPGVVVPSLLSRSHVLVWMSSHLRLQGSSPWCPPLGCRGRATPGHWCARCNMATTMPQSPISNAAFLLWSAAARYGERPAIAERGATVTYAELRDRAAAIATALRSAGRRTVFSGDLVRRDEKGFLYFVGRRDRVIKTMGYRVGPDEIASVLYESGQVVDAVHDMQ